MKAILAEATGNFKVTALILLQKNSRNFVNILIIDKFPYKIIVNNDFHLSVF